MKYLGVLIPTAAVVMCLLVSLSVAAPYRKNKVGMQTEEEPNPIERCLEQYFQAALGGGFFGENPFIRSQQDEDPNTAALERCIAEALVGILASPSSQALPQLLNRLRSQNEDSFVPDLGSQNKVGMQTEEETNPIEHCLEQYFQAALGGGFFGENPFIRSQQDEDPNTAALERCIAAAILGILESPSSQALPQLLNRLRSQNEDSFVPHHGSQNKVGMQTEEEPNPIERCLEQYFQAALGGGFFGENPFIRSQQNEDGSDPNTAAFERCIEEAILGLLASPSSQALPQLLNQLRFQNEDSFVPDHGSQNKVGMQTEEEPNPIEHCLEQYFQAALGGGFFGENPFIRSQQNEDGSDPNTAALERCIATAILGILESPSSQALPQLLNQLRSQNEEAIVEVLASP